MMLVAFRKSVGGVLPQKLKVGPRSGHSLYLDLQLLTAAESLMSSAGTKVSGFGKK